MSARLLMRGIHRLVRRMIDAALAEVHTHMLAEVVSYDAEMNTCSVQPFPDKICIARADAMTTASWPILEDVPVLQLGSGKLWLTVPPLAGTFGTLHINERSIEKWLATADEGGPTSTRRFSISDAVFIPGVVPLLPSGDTGAFVVPIETDRISLRTRDGAASVSVLDDGTVEITTTSKKITVTNGQITEIIDGTEIQLGGTADWAVAYTDLKSAFDSLKQSITDLTNGFNAHMHATAALGAPSVPTPTPPLIPAIPPTADMTAAKVTAVRLP